MADAPTASGAADGANALVGQVLADRYRVVRLLGSGGMGNVYLAEHVLMRKAVALKVLHPEMTVLEEVKARFEREAVAAARIEHANVATAMDCGRLPDGSFYLVLEYVDGKSLRGLIDEGPLEVGRAIAIARQIAAALVAAHAAGVVHRDLKPDNVMLAPHAEGRDSVKVLDFGIAKVLSPEDKKESGRALTRIGAVMGTPGYMSPEQAVGQSVDERADLYALGVVLYEMISARPPFDGDEAAQILAKQLTVAPPPLPAGVPPALSALVMRLLEKAPADRVQTASEVAAELARIADGGDDAALAASARLGPSSMALRDTALLAATAQSVRGTPAASRARRLLPWAALGLGAIGAAVAWRAVGSAAPGTSTAPTTAAAGLSSGLSAASSGASPAPSALSEAAAPAAPAGASAKPAIAGPGVVPAATASHSTTTQTKTTKSGGRTVTTTTKTTRRSSSERSSTPPPPPPQSPPPRKRRTGPGGIYIPPPSEWFK